MDETSIEMTAPTEEEAIILCLARLGITRDRANIEILESERKGFLGFGSREARVRVSVAPPKPVESVPQQAPPVKPAPPQVAKEAPPVASEPPATSVPEKQPEPPPAKPVEAKQPVPSSSEPQKVQEPGAKPGPKAAKEDAKPAPKSKVSARPKHVEGKWDPVEVEQATQRIAERLFSGLRVQIEAEWRDEDRPTLWLSLRGGDADTLVGPRAQTLDSIQYLMRALVHRSVDGNYNLVVDSDGYRERRQRSLVSLAKRMADKAVRTSRSVRLHPMPANERRIIHMTLRDDPRVTTQSRGSGRRRAVSISPRNGSNNKKRDSGRRRSRR